MVKIVNTANNSTGVLTDFIGRMFWFWSVGDHPQVKTIDYS